MKKDMLGSVVRASIAVPQERLDTLAKIASKIAADSPEGAQWHAHLKKLIEEGISGPISFERNEHGHIVITFTGLDLTGAQEIGRLEAAGFDIGNYAKSCFTSTATDGYDANHRLVAGQAYKIALVPGKEIAKDSDRTTANLRKLGMEKYGYGKPLAGHIPRIRETVSDKQMEDMGIWYMVSLHDPINDPDGAPDVLVARRCDAGRGVGAYDDDPGDQWGGGGAFAFPVPAS